MKKTIALVLTLILALSAVTALAGEKLTIGATANPHYIILDFIKEDMKELGYDLELVEFSDYVLPNQATAAGELDANYFQHKPHMVAFNAEVPENEQLVEVIGVHYEPFGIYPGTKKSLDDIAKGDSVLVPNDPSNEARALFLLQDKGLIKLPENAQLTDKLTALDVVDNPYELEIVEVNAELIPSMLEDASYATINGNYAIAAGFSPAKDALFLEPVDGTSGQTYINYIIVRQDKVNEPFVEALKKVLYTQKVKEFIENNEDFGGGVIPVFEVPAQ